MDNEDIRDTTHLRAKEYRTAEPKTPENEPTKVILQPRSITIQVGNMTIVSKDGRDGFPTMVYIDGVDINPKLLYQTVDVHFAEGMTVDVILKCLTGKSEDLVSKPWPCLGEEKTCVYCGKKFFADKNHPEHLCWEHLASANQAVSGM